MTDVARVASPAFDNSIAKNYSSANSGRYDDSHHVCDTASCTHPMFCEREAAAIYPKHNRHINRGLSNVLSSGLGDGFGDKIAKWEVAPHRHVERRDESLIERYRSSTADADPDKVFTVWQARDRSCRHLTHVRR